MKTKVTNKEVRRNFSTIISIGYCSACFLLRRITPFGYSCGVYGWNCDFYEIDGVCISTGYRPIGKSVDYRILKKYDNRAKELSKEQDNDEKFDDLLHEFIKETTNGL
jgi:hypothetical protein